MSEFEVLCSSVDRPRWLEARKLGIGSSDAPAVLGLSPFASPLSVYTDKLGLTEDREQSEAMKWGTLLEPLIVREFGEETKRAVAPAGNLLRSKERPWMLATLDAVQDAEQKDGSGVLEVKATGWRAGDWTEGVPEHVYAQFQHQCAVTDWRWGSVVVLIGGCKLLWSDVERDEDYIERVLLPAEEEFWRRVQAREPVAPDGSDASAEALKRLYPKDNGALVVLPGDLIELDQERVRVSERLKADKERLEEINQTFKAAIGEAQIGVLASGVTYTHKLQERDGYTVKATEFRVLRRSEGKNR